MTFLVASVLLVWSMAVQPTGAHNRWWHLLAYAAVFLLADVGINVSRIAKKLCDDKKPARRSRESA